MARSGRAGGVTGGPANVEITPSVDGFDRQVITIGPADGSDADAIGGLTETAPASDTALSGLNGRLQRLAQKFTSLIALLPAALGGSGGLKVEIVAGGTGGGAVTQSGTWTVQPGNTANTTAWKVDGSAVTQPVSGTIATTAGANIAPTGGLIPVAGTTSVITVGGTAYICVTGPINGGYITNPPNAAAQGIGTAENIYVDPVASPGSTDAAANGTTTLLSAGQTYTIPALASGHNLRANAATSGHKLTVVIW